MDRTRAVDTSYGAEQMSETIRESYQIISTSAVELQERNIRFSQNFFEVWSETLKSQAETNRVVVENLAELSRRQQEAFRTWMQESVGAYLDFLGSMMCGGTKGSEGAKQ